MDPRLESAVRRGDTAALQLLASLVDVNVRNGRGQTALMIAAAAGHGAAVRALLGLGADPDRTGKHGLTALMLAALNGHLDAASALTEAGADPDVRATGAPGFAGRTALDFARTRGDRALITLLQRRGAT